MSILIGAATSAVRVAFVALLAGAMPMRAEQIPVRHIEGTERGFLSVRSQDGALLGVGDLVQTVRGDRVTSRLTFRFKDGSVDDATTVYSQRGTFRLISSRHVQRGPSFPKPMDLSIDATHGIVTVRSAGKDGKMQMESQHVDLPADLANGMTIAIGKNIDPARTETEVLMLVATPEVRIVKLKYSPRGEEAFSVAGSSRKAMRFDIRIALGGVAGVVAPLVGKQPPDLQLWILEGPAPAFVKERGPLYGGGPILTIELSSPVWPRTGEGNGR